MLCHTGTLCCATLAHYNVPFHVFNFLVFYSRKYPVVRTALECFSRVFVACNFRSYFKRKVSGGNFWGEKHHKARGLVLYDGCTSELAGRCNGKNALFGVGGVKLEAAAGYFHDGAGADCCGVA